MHLGYRVILGLLCSTAIGLVAYRRQSLSKSGVLGAVLVGTATFCAHWVWGLLLITFFMLSSLLSHFKASVKEDLAEKFAKGSQRDLGQAMANAGVGATIALLYLAWPDPILWAAFAGSMAAVNADTWATELGVLSKRPPRLITSWRVVEAGTSGGISLYGSLASTAGALSIGLAGVILLIVDGLLGGSGNGLLGSDGILGGVMLLPSALVGGVAGSLLDSLLGATVQGIYYSTSRGKDTERRIDPDGTPNKLARGWPWLGNDLVNALSSLAGALAGVAIWNWVW